MKRYKITLKFKKGNGKDIIAKNGIISINELDLHYEVEERTKREIEQRILKDIIKFEWEKVDDELSERKN